MAEILNYAKKIDFWDIDAMADAIHGLIKYPSLSKMFVENGKKEADSLKWDDSAKHVYSVYKNVLTV